MKRGWGARPTLLRSRESSRGYTVVESLIFLAVSGAMAVAVMMLIAGQQGKAEFQQAVREFEVMLQDVGNDITTGYSSVSGTECSFNGTDVQLVAPTVGNRCVFLGKTLQFGVDGDTSRLATYTVVGRQRTLSGQEATSLGVANAQVLPGSMQAKSLSAMRILSVKVSSPSVSQVGAFGFFTNFGDNGGAAGDNLKSSSINMDVIPIGGTLIGSTESTVMSAIKSNWSAPNINPSGGIELCFESRTNNQRAQIIIGGTSGRNAAPTAIIGGSGLCS